MMWAHTHTKERRESKLRCAIFDRTQVLLNHTLEMRLFTSSHLDNKLLTGISHSNVFVFKMLIFFLGCSSSFINVSSENHHLIEIQNLSRPLSFSFQASTLSMKMKYFERTEISLSGVKSKRFTIDWNSKFVRTTVQLFHINENIS